MGAINTISNFNTSLEMWAARRDRKRRRRRELATMAIGDWPGYQAGFQAGFSAGLEQGRKESK